MLMQILSSCTTVLPPCCGLTMAKSELSYAEPHTARHQDPLTKELYNSLQSKHNPCTSNH